MLSDYGPPHPKGWDQGARTASGSTVPAVPEIIGQLFKARKVWRKLGIDGEGKYCADRHAITFGYGSGKNIMGTMS